MLPDVAPAESGDGIVIRAHGEPVPVPGGMAVEHVATPGGEILKVAEDVPVTGPHPFGKSHGFFWPVELDVNGPVRPRHRGTHPLLDHPVP